MEGGFGLVYFLVKTQLLTFFQQNLDSIHTTKRECFAMQAKKQQTLNLISSIWRKE